MEIAASSAARALAVKSLTGTKNWSPARTDDACATSLVIQRQSCDGQSRVCRKQPGQWAPVANSSPVTFSWFGALPQHVDWINRCAEGHSATTGSADRVPGSHNSTGSVACVHSTGWRFKGCGCWSERRCVRGAGSSGSPIRGARRRLLVRAWFELPASD